MAGDDVTGASTFVIEEGLDTGPVIGTLTERIRATDTAGELLERLAGMRARVSWCTRSRRSLAASRRPLPQPEDGVSYAHKLTRDGRVRRVGVARAHRGQAGARRDAGPRRVDHAARRHGRQDRPVGRGRAGLASGPVASRRRRRAGRHRNHAASRSRGSLLPAARRWTRATGGAERALASPPRWGRREGRTDKAREAAFRCVRSVDAEDAYANLAMPGILAALKLTGRDAAFATELAYGTLADARPLRRDHRA